MLSKILLTTLILFSGVLSFGLKSSVSAFSSYTPYQFQGDSTAVKDKSNDILPQIGSLQKAWTRWWWMGNAVTRSGITNHLEKMAEANFGGVEISPIYGVEGYEKDFVEYLSEEWMNLLIHTVEEARRLGMQVDMITGSGWPFGGSHVTIEDASRRLQLRMYRMEPGEKLNHPVQQINKQNTVAAPLHLLMGYSSEGDSVDLTEYVNKRGELEWIPDENKGSWQLIAFFEEWTNMQVKRAAPGEEGHVIDHFSGRALENYLSRFDNAFKGTEHGLLRAFFNDSYEVGGANWTHDFFDQFKSYRNYDLKDYVPEFLGMNFSERHAAHPEMSSREITRRIQADFHETLHDLALNRFVIPWRDWAHSKGSLSRNQAHGFPANILDIYGATDIPEIEIFGQAQFRIPGLRTNSDVSHRIDSPNPLILKFASSAAHVEGRDLTSSETGTWLDEHFMVSLSQLRPHADMQFIAGINHTVYHGSTYSPQEETWPGWKFYASTHVAPSNTFWKDLGDFNRYMANSQSILQEGKPANDILLYFPIHDLWHEDRREAGEPYFIRVHNPDEWFYGTNFGNTAEIMWERGYAFDYISDRQIDGIEVQNNLLYTGDTRYKTIVIPDAKYIPLKTLERLMEIAHTGGTVIFKNKLPVTVTGFNNFDERQKRLDEIYRQLDFESVKQGIMKAEVGSGQILKGENTDDLFAYAGIQREPIADTGLNYIRRSHDEGSFYFISNLHAESVNKWIPLATEARSVMMYDPYSEKMGMARVRTGEFDQTEVYLQLKPGESRVLKTYHSDSGPEELSVWEYFQESGQAILIEGEWTIRFMDGGPILPEDKNIDHLQSWTELEDRDAERFAGTARYSIDFQRPEIVSDGWKLRLGKVAESAVVYLNGKEIASVWSHPFEIEIDDALLLNGVNRMEIDVTNLMINRIIDMDQRGIRWQKFYDINMVDINYQSFDSSDWEPMVSGLIGPVELIPLVEEQGF